ncbi:hypothetical protein IV203_034595 [Nitzschia inconspicua]|uniref:Uncharacterized protein n=1 Tax=Nitzschia inconspicua TaxID=303405 RepID=A0A9K3PBG1_9STRA|nr:hypothetical protein IV203_002653 [Nitzschia inconspicua]KAG7359497.1 hypothetical protein IV203_034595 [Nitzschia inconspicua]
MAACWSPSLSIYFQELSLQMNIFGCDNIRIVVDNARIPIRCACNEDSIMSSVTGPMDHHRCHEGMIQIPSNDPVVSTLSPILMEDQHSSASSRWESFNSSSASTDISLEMPHRTRDQEEGGETDLDSFNSSRQLPSRHTSQRQDTFLDPMERILLELPLDTSRSHFHSDNSSCSSSDEHSSRQRSDASSYFSEEGPKVDSERLPYLQSFDRFTILDELHPREVLRRLCKESSNLSTFGQDDNSHQEFQRVKQESTLAQKIFESKDHSFSYCGGASNQQVDSIHTLRFHPKFSFRDRFVAFSQVQAARENQKAKMKFPMDLPVDGESKLLQNQDFFRWNFVDFPLPPSLPPSLASLESRKFHNEGMENVFESTGRILGITSDGCDASSPT